VPAVEQRIKRSLVVVGVVVLVEEGDQRRSVGGRELFTR
jgi:hypothetical protein